MIRLIIAEDVRMVRGALVALLDLEPDLAVVAEVGNGDDILPVALKYCPDLAIVDIELPGMDGLTAAAKLRSRLPDCRVLVLTGLTHPTVLRRAMTNNVHGLLLKDAPSSQLADAVRKVAAGQRVVDPQLSQIIWNANDDVLSPREIDVLLLAADGEDATVIAEQLHLSVGTVRNYLTTIVSKLGARNRIDAIRIARSVGLI